MATTVEYTVGGTDAWALQGAHPNVSYLFSSDAQIWIGWWSGSESGVARWSGVTIPAGATITTAYIIVKANGSDSPFGSSRIYFEKALNPSSLTTVANYNARTLTNHYATWEPAAWVDGTLYNTADIKAVIQELVDAYDYHSGSSMLASWIGQDGGENADVGIVGYSTGAPVLHIEYTTGGAVGGRMCQVIII